MQGRAAAATAAAAAATATISAKVKTSQLTFRPQKNGRKGKLQIGNSQQGGEGRNDLYLPAAAVQ